MTIDHLSERPPHPRPRRVGTAGGGGLVRPALSQAPGPDPRVRRHRPPDRSPATNRWPTTATTTRCPTPGAPGWARPLKSTMHPLPHRHPDLPRRRRAEERRPGGRDRRRLAGHALLPQGRRLLPRAPGRGLRRAAPARGGARRLRGRCDRLPLDHRRRRRGGAPTVIRPTLALYIGGMGARGANFHFDVFARMGFEAEAAKIQELYLAGQEGRHRRRPHRDGRGHGPHRPPGEDPRRPRRLGRAGVVTTLLVNGPPALLRGLAEIVL